MREAIEAQDKVYNQQSLVYQNEPKPVDTEEAPEDSFLLKIQQDCSDFNQLALTNERDLERQQIIDKIQNSQYQEFEEQKSDALLAIEP